ncbi:MAG: Wzt carbohydrate-binding domain-containing protein, partial [Lachnospiraceae bacterium]|nr:Wzt carbohydrate-binding domain-containing protein [Lachnospiraceae bacterium]
AEDYADSTEEPKLSEGEELEDESTEVSKDELPKDNQTKTEKTQSIQSNDETLMKSKISINPNVSSYGNDKAEIVDFAVMDANGNITNSIEKDSKFKIVMRVRFKDDIKDPIFAYTIKDLKGTDINGSNTMAERINVPAMKKGDEKLITFTQTMHLHSNEYLLSLGVTGFEENEFVVYHRLYDVCNILTISDKTPLGIVDLDSEISIE